MIRKSALLFLLALSALTLITSNADAWWWRHGCGQPLFPCIGCRLHHGYPVTTCWHPYNAFSTPPGCARRHVGCNAFAHGCGHNGCGHNGCGAGHMAMSSPVMTNPMQMAQYFDPSLLPYMNQETLVDAGTGHPVQQDIQPAAYMPAYGMQPYAMPQYPAPYYPSPYAMPYGYQAYPSYWYSN